ncbi:MAG: hydrolase [Betaproteobacteria bacterium]|nr:hydrolase [Betaproteobacteria bacterium]
MRDAIIREAESWLDPPTLYHHAADIKSVGVDCAMLLVRVFCDLGLAPAFDPRPYPHDWMLHRSEERFLGWVEQFAVRVDEPAPGRVAIFRFGRCASHGGILCDGGMMIHADLRAGRVIRSELATYAHRLHSIWSVHGV